MDNCLHLVYPDGNEKYSFKTIPLNNFTSSCGLLVKDDTILMISDTDQSIYLFDIKDEYLLDPHQIN